MWLVKEYDVVAVEDPDVKPMLETSQSAKNKQDAAWAQFLGLLEYKGNLHGTHVVRVDARGTTKACKVWRGNVEAAVGAGTLVPGVRAHRGP